MHDVDLSRFPDILPRKQPFKRLVIKIVLFILGRALQSLSNSDPVIQAEVKSWGQPLTFMMSVAPQVAALAVSSNADGRLKVRRQPFNPEEAEVVIYIHTVNAAFQMFTAQMGTHTAYARHEIYSRGNVALTVSIARIINIVMAVLFPAFIAKNTMKRLPDIPFLKKQALRLKTYLVGIAFGI